MDTRAWAANHLAARLLAGPWTLQTIAAAINSVLGPVRPRMRAALAIDLLAMAEETYPPAPHALTNYLIGSKLFKPSRRRPVASVLDPPRFAPLKPFGDLPIPALATLGELAARLGLGPEQVD